MLPGQIRSIPHVISVMTITPHAEHEVIPEVQYEVYKCCHGVDVVVVLLKSSKSMELWPLERDISTGQLGAKADASSRHISSAFCRPYNNNLASLVAQLASASDC